MVKKTKPSVVDNLTAFSALLVCILPHCRLRDWCGNLRNDSDHVVCRLDQSASLRIFDSTFYFSHSTFRILPTALWYPSVQLTDITRLLVRFSVDLLKVNIKLVQNATEVYENTYIIRKIINLMNTITTIPKLIKTKSYSNRKLNQRT